MTRIEDALRSFNPWWEGKFRVDYKEREIYEDIEKYMKLPMMISLSGLRRVGKSTLMLKVVEDAISGGLQPERVLYFSFDNFHEIEPEEVIRIFEGLHSMDIRNGKYLFLFDEIQKLDDWQNKIKMIYDLHKGRIKIMISGSESLFIRSRARESLAGRLFELKVNPLSFREYLVFSGERTVLEHPSLYKKEREGYFRDYARSQGFPELVGIRDKETIRKYLTEGVIDTVIYRDIPALFGRVDVSILKQLLDILTDMPGQIIELSALASDLKISRQTLSSYIMYLEESQLIRRLYNYSTNSRKSQRKLKKYYPSIASVDMLFRDDDLSESRSLEWLVVSRLGAEFFWRDAYKNEVDIVMEENGAVVPVEVKFGKISTGGIEAFMKKFKVGRGIVASYDREERIKVDGGEVNVVPANKLLANTVPAYHARKG